MIRGSALKLARGYACIACDGDQSVTYSGGVKGEREREGEIEEGRGRVLGEKVARRRVGGFLLKRACKVTHGGNGVHGSAACYDPDILFRFGGE